MLRNVTQGLGLGRIIWKTKQRQGPVAGSCEHGNELQGLITGGELDPCSQIAMYE
jgi:hypothetical protein